MNVTYEVNQSILLSDSLHRWKNRFIDYGCSPAFYLYDSTKYVLYTPMDRFDSIKIASIYQNSIEIDKIKLGGITHPDFLHYQKPPAFFIQKDTAYTLIGLRGYKRLNPDIYIVDYDIIFGKVPIHNPAQSVWENKAHYEVTKGALEPVDSILKPELHPGDSIYKPELQLFLNYRSESPSITGDNEGNIYLTWASPSFTDTQDIYGLYRSQNGWSQIINISETPEMASHSPYLGCNPYGTDVVWDEGENVVRKQFSVKKGEGVMEIIGKGNSPQIVNGNFATFIRNNYVISSEYRDNKWIKQDSVEGRFPYLTMKNNDVYLSWVKPVEDGWKIKTKFIGIAPPWPITSGITSYNNARRFFSHKTSIYLLYHSSNLVYFLKSDDNGETWGSPEPVSDTVYWASPPTGGVTSDGRIYALWERGNELYYSIRENGTWSTPAEIPSPYPNIYFFAPPSVAIEQDTCHLFIETGHTFANAIMGPIHWLYGKFSIDNPVPAWTQIDSLLLIDTIPQPPQKDYFEFSPTITLKNGIPLLGYIRENEIKYAQPVDTVWYKWNISNSPDRFSRSPSIDYSNGYVNLTWVEESAPGSQVPVVECASIIPATDSTLDYNLTYFKERPFYADEPFVITKDWLYWEEEDSAGKKVVRRARYDDTTFAWDYPEDVSSIPWADARYPQAVYYRPRTDGAVGAFKVLASVWSEGIAPDFGIQERDETFSQVIPASANLGGETPSPYTIQREGWIDYSGGTEPYEIVDYHPDELIYHIDELNPDFKNIRYKLRLALYQKSGDKEDWMEKIIVDQTPRGEVKLSSGEVEWFEKKLPPVDTEDGEITLRIKKKKGNYAVCGVLYLYEYAPGGKGTGGKGKEGRKSSSEFPEEVYVRLLSPIFCGKVGIEFGLPKDRDVQLNVYDVAGRCVRRPVNGRMKAGVHRVKVENLPSGVYFYHFTAKEKEKKGKIVNLR